MASRYASESVTGLALKTASEQIPDDLHRRGSAYRIYSGTGHFPIKAAGHNESPAFSNDQMKLGLARGSVVSHGALFLAGACFTRDLATPL